MAVTFLYAFNTHVIGSSSIFLAVGFGVHYRRSVSQARLIHSVPLAVLKLNISL